MSNSNDSRFGLFKLVILTTANVSSDWDKTEVNIPKKNTM